MIRSNGLFLQELAAATTNIMELARVIKTFMWSEAYETKFQNLKTASSEDVLLRH